MSVSPLLPQLAGVGSLVMPCVDLNSYTRLLRSLGLVSAVCFRSLSKLLNELHVHFSHLSLHEVGLWAAV